MKLVNLPSTKYAFGYKNPPRSGNEINGLGLNEKIRASYVFHYSSDTDSPWKALDNFFSFINPWGVVRHLLANVWQLRNQDGPVNQKKKEVIDKRKMANEIKSLGKSYGADLIGITEITDNAVYKDKVVPFKYAICIGLAMNRAEMIHAAHPRASVEVMRSYKVISKIAIKLGKKIRDMGWHAKAYGNPNSTDLLHIPLAINAGLGQLGKHGSMISRLHGSNFRLASVVTDLPMSTDEAVDIGVDDLCMKCQRCVIDCPPSAIFREKQMVRGEEKWYVNFDACIPYFVKTFGCAICIEVCPWSEPGRGSWLSEMILISRNNKNVN